MNQLQVCEPVEDMANTLVQALRRYAVRAFLVIQGSNGLALTTLLNKLRCDAFNVLAFVMKEFAEASWRIHHRSLRRIPQTIVSSSDDGSLGLVCLWV
ncbi:MAG TPA: hypothetical protein DEF47_22495 [Herpetosiphon sp.]|uniref:hypothetical protein n=1 Tax=Herpetosiphon sp. TaxID=71864 RepID=UPI00059BB299|nr:hypothetical protein [Herpetosiphon sp.]HBW52660.1 hypothetical protein [Herpetosiphon sp.]